MRSLTDTLTAAQKSRGFALCKAVIASGVTSYEYNVTSTNRLLRVKHRETPWSQTATIVVDDVDLTLSGLSLEGYTTTLSYGYNTSAGDEFSATAPLIVKAQELVTTDGVQQCVFDCIGKPDQMNNQYALSDLNLTSSDGRTVKTLISAIMGATLAPFNHLTAITVTYDSEDSLIDSFTPNDYFRVSIGESQADKVSELLGYTKCVGIFKADGNLHIFNPTVSGATYDYSYNDTFLAANHTFFSRVYRNRLIIPSKITVKSSADHAPTYTGSATDSASYAKWPDAHKPYTRRLASDAQATSIAEAMIQRLQVAHQRGNGRAPMNCGQEVYDYVNVTSSEAGNARAGNIGYLERTWDADATEPFTIAFGFGDIALGGTVGTSPLSGGVGTAPQYVTYEEFRNQIGQLQGNISGIIDFINTWERVNKWHVTDSLIIPNLTP